MHTINVQNLVKWMQQFAIDAGEILLRFRGKVEDIGKENYEQGGSEYHAEGTTKTKIDEIIQELALAYLYNSYPRIRINVEEDTPLKFLFEKSPFKNSHPNLIFHLDPLDGTLEYLSTKDNFSVGMALSDQDINFTHTVICIPVLNKLFIASPDGSHILDNELVKQEPEQSPGSNLVYEKRLLSSSGRQALRDLGFTIEKTPPSHYSIIHTVLGKATAFLYGGSHVHDGLIPLAFARANGCPPLNILGKPLDAQKLRRHQIGQVVKFERIPSLCYFHKPQGSDAEKILEVLSDKNNLHKDYLEKYASLEYH